MEKSKMTKEQFVNKVAEMFRGSEYAEAVQAKSVCAQNIDKVSGPYYGIVVTTENGVGVCVNLEDVYSKYISGDCEGGDFFDVALHYCAEAASKGISRGLSVDFEKWEAISSRIPVESLRMVLVDRANVGSFPHVDVFGNLAVIFRVVFDSVSCMSSAVVTDKLLTEWGTTAAVLYMTLCEKSPEYYPADFISMEERIAELTGGQAHGVPADDVGLYILSCSGSDYAAQYGSGAILYPGEMERIAEKIGGSYFLLPSSIHELLILKDDGNSTAVDLFNMVKGVNAAEVSAEDKLADAVYYYDAVRAIMMQVAG